MQYRAGLAGTLRPPNGHGLTNGLPGGPTDFASDGLEPKTKREASMAAEMTVTALRARWSGADRWLSDGGSRGAGRLVARIVRDGVQLYYKYFHEGERRRLPLGPYDEKGVRGLSLVQARDRAAELSALFRSGATDLHAHFEREREADERRHREAAEAARRAEDERQRGTLKQLVETYVAHLERQNKQATKDARSILTKHIIEGDPALAARRAAELTVEELVAPIAKLVAAGKGRTAAKCRSYLRAAYQLAVRGRTDPAAPIALRSYGITANPVASIDARSLAEFNRVRTRALSADELGAYVKRLEALPEGAQKDALLVALLLGGQRPAQLLRAQATDVDLSAATLTLYDGKGARRQPRPHVLPLTKEAAAIIKRRLDALTDGEPLFSTDRAHAMRIETLSGEVAAIVKKMRENDPPEAREDFELRDIRRTCETMLAGLKVSRDVRAQLLSHGLGGVQHKHYDMHDYTLDKRQALLKWARHLEQLKEGKTADVVPIGGKRKGARS